MTSFELSLLREKIFIRGLNDSARNAPLEALSNRIVCTLSDSEGRVTDTLIVRAQTSYSCIRMAAHIVKHYNSGGSIVIRSRFDWDRLWEDIHSTYEETYNPNYWLAVYHDGNVIFNIGERPSFLDIIEQCDFTHDGSYEQSTDLAEDAFAKTGRSVDIEHDTNTALMLRSERDKDHVGLVLRDAHRSTIFKFAVSRKLDGNAVSIVHNTLVAGAYLEAIQLCFLIGANTAKLGPTSINSSSDIAKKTRNAQARLGQLRKEINALETGFTVSYKPEAPNFKELIQNAQEFTRKQLSAEEAE